MTSHSILHKMIFYRFFFLTSSFILTMFVYNNRILSLQVVIPISDKATEDVMYKDMDTVLTTMWTGSLVAHLIEYVGLFTGISYNRFGYYTLSVTCHFLGSFFLLCGMLDNWQYAIFCWVFVLFSYLPALLESCNIFIFVLFEYDIMNKVEIRV
ncbi:hypothetical protein ScalyP_jg2976 [Parmales sp. scaly parma]|nr:hypothetical protein ScalyP_jg2976 [Parmales sp. scaly parma]